MDDTQKTIEELKTEIISLKIRLARVEGFIGSMPDPNEYINTEEPSDGSQDPLVEQAINIVCQYDRASASLIQRKLSIGYARAARLLDQLEELGIVGPGTGSEPRNVLIKDAKEYFVAKGKT
jgi:DNA segregation ATPase FtsK/SpoIIIE-like protein